MKSLKTQFILSHILPVIVTIPLIAMALSYAMKTHYILKDMKKTITYQANLIRDYAEWSPEIWMDKVSADEFIREIRPQLVTGVILFDKAWNLLAFSDNGMVEKAPENCCNHMPTVGQTNMQPILNISAYNPFHKTDDFIEMMVPVSNNQNELLGIIRLNLPDDYFEEQLDQTSGQIILILICGIVLGILIGLFNAVSLEKSLNRTANAILELSTGVRDNPLPETGPKEIAQLSVAFNQLAEKLKSSEQKRTKLVSFLTHELGRPLGALSSAVDSLSLGAYQDEQLTRDLTRGMKNEVKRLELLVGDLSILREESDPQNQYLFSRVDLTRWLMESYQYWAEFAMSKGVSLINEIAVDLPAVEMDPFRFHQAVGNLLSNAIKYSPKGGRVILRAGVNGEEIQINVIDFGPGISEADLPNIFNSFYRGTEKKRFTQGMGLGLAIAKEVIKAHKGKITVNSVPGEGSTFTIHLPFPSSETDPDQP